MSAVQECFQEFLRWPKRREMRHLGGDWKTWFRLQQHSDQEALRQQWAGLSPDEVEEFVEFLAQQVTPDGLYIAFPDLLAAFQDQAQLCQAFRQCLARHGVIRWQERVGVKGIFVTSGEGKAEDVKPVKAFVVAGRGKNGPPKTYASNFTPDERCEDAMDRAAQACLSLFAWWRMTLALLGSFMGNAPWISLHTVLPKFAELRWVHRWVREVLGGCEVYLQIEGADLRIEGTSIFGSAFVALLLALEALSQDVKPTALPLLVRHFVVKVKQKAANFAISSDGTETGWLKAIGDERKKEDAACKTGLGVLIFPRHRERSESQDRKQTENALSEPVRSHAAVHLEPLRASGALTVRRYRHVWEMILDIGGLWHRGWFALYFTAVLLFFAWSHLFQKATISGGRAEEAGRALITVDHHLEGEARGLDVLTFQIEANSYWPPLQLEIEAAKVGGLEIGLFALAAEGDFHGTLVVQVEPNGYTQLRYWCRRTLPAGLPDTPVVSVRNFYGKLLDRKVLILRVMRAR